MACAPNAANVNTATIVAINANPLRMNDFLVFNAAPRFVVAI
jgi:hypothetical protein